MTRGETLTTCDSATDEIVSELLADELDFDIDNFNRQIVNENFNRAVLEEIAAELNPKGLYKTLIFAVNDSDDPNSFYGVACSPVCQKKEMI